MAQTYTATAKQNPGRKAWLIEFRHPLRTDGAGKPGKKTRKGLGPIDQARAELLADQLTQLLANDSLWSLGARGEAAKLFEPEVVEIFYSELEPKAVDHRALRDKLLPLPLREEGYCKAVLVGIPGAGKTTLIRQLLGTHPQREAFPSTSLNRTTTFPAEFVIRPGVYEGVVTFLTEGEVRFELEECISAAIVEAVDGDDAVIAQTFLEKSDMRFRLKYLLGDLSAEGEEVDPYSESQPDEETEGDERAHVNTAEQASNAVLIRGYLDRIHTIAQHHKLALEASQGALSRMTAPDRSAALDLIEQDVDDSQDFLELVSDVLDQLRVKFNALDGVGKYEKTTTGWPRAWHMRSKSDRKELISALRFFSGIGPKSWGKLLTPLVSGMRVQGPFHPHWASAEPRLVVMDTEGLGHKATATADLPEQTVELLQESDVILLVDSVKNGLTNFAAGKAMETVANTGMTRKLALVFTHMDTASTSGLKGQRLHNQIFSSVRNVADNQLSKSVSPESARFLVESLQNRTFFLGRLDKADARGAEPELNKLLNHLMVHQTPPTKPVTVPVYDRAFLMLALQEAAGDFRRQWQGILGIAPDPTHKPRKWQTIKALARRYAENLTDSFELRPTSNLRTALEVAVSRFLEAPTGWSGNPTQEQRRETIEQLKETVTKQLPDLARRRLRELPQVEWYGAWTPRGAGSTTTRRIRIEGIYERWVPIPNARSDQAVMEFIRELEELVQVSLDDFKARVEAVGT